MEKQEFFEGFGVPAEVVKKAGRPSTKGPLRNLRLRREIDEFLLAEAADPKRHGRKGRSGKSITLYIEQAVEILRVIKPEVRDQMMSGLFKKRD